MFDTKVRMPTQLYPREKKCPRADETKLFTIVMLLYTQLASEFTSLPSVAITPLRWQQWWLDMNPQPWDGEVGVLPLCYHCWSINNNFWQILVLLEQYLNQDHRQI
jgi:hypothetical protein